MSSGANDPKIMTSEFSGKVYIVTKTDKAGVALEKFDITEQIKAYTEKQLEDQANKDLSDKVEIFAEWKKDEHDWKLAALRAKLEGFEKAFDSHDYDGLRRYRDELNRKIKEMEDQ